MSHAAIAMKSAGNGDITGAEADQWPAGPQGGDHDLAGLADGQRISTDRIADLHDAIGVDFVSFLIVALETDQAEIGRGIDRECPQAIDRKSTRLNSSH